jgi:hypothetical protein
VVAANFEDRSTQLVVSIASSTADTVQLEGVAVAHTTLQADTRRLVEVSKGDLIFSQHCLPFYYN